MFTLKFWGLSIKSTIYSFSVKTVLTSNGLTNVIFRVMGTYVYVSYGIHPYRPGKKRQQALAHVITSFLQFQDGHRSASPHRLRVGNNYLLGGFSGNTFPMSNTTSPLLMSQHYSRSKNYQFKALSALVFLRGGSPQP